MEVEPQTKSPARTGRRAWIVLAAILLVALAAGIRFWQTGSFAEKSRGAGAVQVISAPVTSADVAVTLTANGTVSPCKRSRCAPQISATIKAVHIKEGQFVRKGDRLFTLDARTEEANLEQGRSAAGQEPRRSGQCRAQSRAPARVVQPEVHFADRARYRAKPGGRPARASLRSIRPPWRPAAWRAVSARSSRRLPGAPAPSPSIRAAWCKPSSGAALVSITQIDPINVSFTLPERELAGAAAGICQGRSAGQRQARIGRPACTEGPAGIHRQRGG